MAIDVNKVQSANVTGSAGSTTCRFTVPLDVQPDDLFLFFAAGGAAGPDSPYDGHAPITVSGAGGTWVEAAAGSGKYDDADGGTGVYLSVFWAKGLTAGALVEASTAPERLMWASCIARVSGSATAPVDVVGAFGVGTDADPSTVTAPSITPTVNDVLLFYFMAETAADPTSFQNGAPTGWTRVMYQVTLITNYAASSMLAVKGGDAAPTGPVASQPIAKSGAVFNPRPVAVMVAIKRGGCVDGTVPFLSTDGVVSEGP